MISKNIITNVAEVHYRIKTGLPWWLRFCASSARARIRSLVKELRAKCHTAWPNIHIIITATKWKQGLLKTATDRKAPRWQSTSSQRPRSHLAMPLSRMAVCTGFLSWPESLQLGFWEDWTLTLGRDMALFAMGSWQACLQPSFHEHRLHPMPFLWLENGCWTILTPV